MDSEYAELKSDDRIVARFLTHYHKNWQSHFPGLNKRAHWHVIFSAAAAAAAGVPCRTIHRTLYGAYGTDIRTCIERIKDCERDGFVRVLDSGGEPCAPSASCLIAGAPKLYESFAEHCRDTIEEVCAIFGKPRGRANAIACDDAAIAAIFNFFGAYDQKWRETGEEVVGTKDLTPAYFTDAMDHLVTYQYWAVVMLLWSASAFRDEGAEPPALVIDEINSRMWDVLHLGHLAIKERVNNLIRWGFFAEETVNKHKAVSLVPLAEEAIGRSLADSKPLLRELHGKLVAERAEAVSG